jgi:hypothetical protein
MHTELVKVVVLHTWAAGVSLVPSRDVCEIPQHLLLLMLPLGPRSWLLGSGRTM